VDCSPSNFGKQTSTEATIGTITIVGTLDILIQIGLIVGGLVGLAYLGIRRFLPVGRLRAPAYGIVLVVVATGLIIEFNIQDFDILPRALSVALFGLLLFVYGLLTAWLIDRFAHPLTQLPGRRGLSSSPQSWLQDLHWTSRRSSTSLDTPIAVAAGARYGALAAGSLRPRIADHTLMYTSWQCEPDLCCTRDLKLE
jgi:hypothetical protein